MPSLGFSYDAGREAWVVTSVAAISEPAKVGARVGDIVVSVNGAVPHDALDSAPSGQHVISSDRELNARL